MKLELCRSTKLTILFIGFVGIIAHLFSPSYHVYATQLDDVKQNKILYFGTAPTYFPFTYYDEQGDLTGLDIALINEIGKRIGVEVKFVDIAYTGLPDACLLHQIDLIGGALPVDMSLQQWLDFSRVYYRGNYRFMMPKGIFTSDSFSTKELYWMRLGVTKGSALEQYVKSKLIGQGIIDPQQVFWFNKVEDAEEALNWNEIDAVFLEELIYNKKFRIKQRYDALAPSWIEDQFAFAAIKGSALIPEVTRLLNLMMTDGTAANIAEKFAKQQISNGISTYFDRIPFAGIWKTGGDGKICHYALRFQGDVTIPDGAILPPQVKFTKTWRISNNGTCIWEEGTLLTRISGREEGETTVVLNQRVLPGETIELTVQLKTPEQQGSSISRWQMVRPDGIGFGQMLSIHTVIQSKKE